MTLPLIAGSATDNILIRMVIANPSMSHPASSSSAVNLNIKEK